MDPWEFGRGNYRRASLWQCAASSHRFPSQVCAGGKAVVFSYHQQIPRKAASAGSARVRQVWSYATTNKLDRPQSQSWLNGWTIYPIKSKWLSVLLLLLLRNKIRSLHRCHFLTGWTSVSADKESGWFIFQPLYFEGPGRATARRLNSNEVQPLD